MTMLRILPFVLTLIFCSCNVAGDDTTSRADEANQRTVVAAKRYEISLSDNDPANLELRPKSLLRWSNPIAGELYGNVFVWTHDGRPAVIGSLLQWYSPHTHASHEFHSLSTNPLRVKRDGRLVWNCQQTLPMKSLPLKIPASATTRILNTRMRALAGRFSVEKEDREAKKRQLRMLPQPLMRYANEENGLLAGGLFVFVQGTDPEVILVLEAHRDRGKVVWKHAFARMNSVKFVAEFDGDPIWSVEIMTWGEAQSGRSVYYHSGTR